MTEGTEPTFEGSTRADRGFRIIGLGSVLVVFATIAVLSSASGGLDWTLVGGAIIIGVLLAVYAIPVVLPYHYEFYEDHFAIKHRGSVEVFHYSDVARWQAARSMPLSTSRKPIRIEIRGREKGISLSYLPYSMGLRTYLSDFLDRKIPEKRMKESMP
jgi:hypothetical protein